MPPVPLGILVKLSRPGGLLRRAEAAMVGRGGLEIAGGEAGPQGVLVMLGAERRAHDIGGGGLPVGVPVDRFVDHELLGQDLAEDAVAGGAGAGNRLGGLLGRDVDDIDRRSQHIGDGDGALGGLALHLRRAGQGVAFGAGDALVEHLLLEMEDGVAVLGMDGAEGAQFLRAGEAVQKDAVIDHDGALVGHEVLEGVDAVLAGQHAHLFPHLIGPPRDGDVEGIVGRRLFAPGAPLADRLRSATAAGWGSRSR